MGTFLFNIFFYILVLVLATIFLIITVLIFPFTVPFDKSRRAVHEVSRCISMLFLRIPPGWKTRVRGMEFVDKKQTYVIVLNHRSMVDIPMLYWIPLNFRWVSKSSNKWMPFIGQLMSLHGDILIPLEKPRKAISMIMEKGLMWLRDRKVCVAIFPEGSRSKTGEIEGFKSTAFTLAKEAGVGILPVVLDGSNVLGKNGKVLWNHTFTVQVLEPVSADEVANRRPKEIMNETRDRMVAAKQSIVAELKKAAAEKSTVASK